MSNQAPPAGELFSRVYIERGPPSRDSEKFWRRLDAYIEMHIADDASQLRHYLQREAGVTGIENPNCPFFYLAKRSTAEALDGITLVHRYIGGWRSMGPGALHQANEWRDFVTRALNEENVGYKLDEQCGVHYLVDEEFERTRVSALRAADGKRYGAVRAAYEQAYKCMDATPPDTKGAVRSIFESLEILSKLMVPGATKLDADLVAGELTRRMQKATADGTEHRALAKVMLGFADWVNGVHFYRHGQGTHEPIAPPPEFAVYVLSSGAAMLRLLLQMDAYASLIE